MRYEYQDRVALSALIHCNFRRSSSMKTRLIVIMVAMLAFYGVVSAQGYHIRTTFHTNLRDTYSLSGGIVETVAPGTVLHVVGNFNRWLKINRNGNEAWMADWVPYTRVDGSQQTQTQQQTSSNIDNCCFVDRQCSTNQQWTDGYWAFQNGQCTAPAQSQEQTSTPATGSVPANIDNCCYVNRQCSTDQQWTDGYFAYQNNQCNAPAQSQPQAAGQFQSLSFPRTPSNASTVSKASLPFDNCCYMHHETCHSSEDWSNGYWAFQNHQCTHPAPIPSRPSIEGPANYVYWIEKALELLEIHAPEWLNFVYSSGLRQIVLDPHGGGSSGFLNTSWTFSWSHSPSESYRQNPAWLPGYDEILGMVGVIVHESCHSFQQRTYTQTSIGWRNELPCVEAQMASIQKIDPGHRWADAMRNVIANIQDPATWWWT